jgi:hypothetical protein
VSKRLLRDGGITTIGDLPLKKRSGNTLLSLNTADTLAQALVSLISILQSQASRFGTLQCIERAILRGSLLALWITIRLLCAPQWHLQANFLLYYLAAQ